MLTPEQKDAVEILIDRDDLSSFLEAVALICFEKASHVAEAWQDVALADAWSKAGVQIDKVSAHKAVKNVSFSGVVARQRGQS